MYLIARSGRPVAREELVELLWPNADPQVAIHRLHVSASALRHALDERDASESAVQYHAEAYQIPAEFALTDCTLFDGFTREARRYIEKQDFPAAATSFRTALDLYQGDYLADQQYTEWTSQARAHYVELRLQALTFLCQHAIQTQQLPLVADYAREILEVDNLRERAHRDLMPVHYQLGQKACAIRQYQACAAILRTELDVTPSRLTTQLYQAICQDSELPVEMSLFSTTLNQGAVSRA